MAKSKRCTYCVAAGVSPVREVGPGGVMCDDCRREVLAVRERFEAASKPGGLPRYYRHPFRRCRKEMHSGTGWRD